MGTREWCSDSWLHLWPTDFCPFVFLGFIYFFFWRGGIFTKTGYVLCIRLRNSVLNNLIHSHGFDYMYKPTTPSALSPSQISPWSLWSTYGLLMGSFHSQISNLTGLKVSSPIPHTLLPVSASGTRVRPLTQARDWGCSPFPYSSHARGPSKAPHVHCLLSFTVDTASAQHPSPGS